MPARYTDEFKIEDVRQVTINKHSTKETAERLEVHPEFLRSRTKRFGSPKAIEKSKEKDSADTKIKRLHKELKRVTEEQIAIILMMLSKRYVNCPLWLAGFGLLVLVVLKVFFVELSSSSTIERIISFIVAGSLLLLIRYFISLPPNENEKS